MTPTLFLDADIVLDLLAKREPWFQQRDKKQDTHSLSS